MANILRDGLEFLCGLEGGGGHPSSTAWFVAFSTNSDLNKIAGCERAESCGISRSKSKTSGGPPRAQSEKKTEPGGEFKCSAIEGGLSPTKVFCKRSRGDQSDFVRLSCEALANTAYISCKNNPAPPVTWKRKCPRSSSRRTPSRPHAIKPAPRSGPT